MKKEKLAAGLALALLLGCMAGCAKAPAQEQEVFSEEAPGLTEDKARQPEASAPEEETEVPSLYEPEPGQWGGYADLYEAYFLDGERTMPVSKSSSPMAQLIDLDQNGVPELALYYGVTTAGMTLDIFTIEDGAVKRLGDEITWNPYRNEEYRMDIPAIENPSSWEVVLTDSTYMCLDARILPFDWDYGAFSARMDAKTGESFWLFACRSSEKQADDGQTYEQTGAYWRFENTDGKIQQVKLERFGLRWDENQPFFGYSIDWPGEEPEEITFDQSCAVAINGESSAEITQAFTAEQGAKYPPLGQAPEASRLKNLYAGSDPEGELLVRRFFRSFHKIPTQEDLQITAKTALCRVFTSNDRARYAKYQAQLEEGADPEQALRRYYEDFADVLTDECQDDWMAAQTPFSYDKQLEEANCRTEAMDVSLEEAQRREDVVIYSFTATLLLYDFDGEQELTKNVTGQIQVSTAENRVQKLTLDPGQDWTKAS